MQINRLGAWIVCFLTAFFPLAFSLPADPWEKIISGFERHLTEMPEEKIYLHLDRPYYASGETIWFKAYLAAGPYHKPSSLSNTIYVELINSEGEIVKLLKLYSSNGFVSGHLDLPDSLSSGNYLVRSYTNWMRNSGNEYFYHCQIRILNPYTDAYQEEKKKEIDIQFFPEGGTLVNGILSKVAFKAIGSDGLGKVIKGRILDGDSVITEFQSNKLGMGVFGLNPQKGKQYRALIEEYGNNLELPIALDSGIVLSVTNSPKSEDIFIKLQTTGNLDIQTIHLLAQTRGMICASSSAELSKNIIFVKIPKKEFPTGITQITAINQDGLPLAERLIFIDHQDNITISVSNVRPVYAPRDSIGIDIEVKDNNGLPVEANLSLSIYDSEQISVDENKETITSNLLISSELKGHIESPGYYFNPKNRNREEALDILMLTQGWSKFTIADALTYESPAPEFGIEKGLTVKGEVIDKNSYKPIESGTVSYLSLFPFFETKEAQSDSNGKFEIKDLIYFDSTEVYLQGKSKNGSSTVKIAIKNTYQSPPFKYSINSYPSLTSNLEKDFLSKSLERDNIDKAFNFDESEISLDEVEVQGKKIKDQNLSSAIFGEGTLSINVAGNLGLENQNHPLDLVKGRVAGVQISGNGTNWKVLIQGVGSINSGTDPLILIDNVPVRLESLSMIPVQDIERFTVWKGPDTAVFGSRGANGVIGFYTKKGKEEFRIPGKNADHPMPMGYQMKKEFYSPKYGVKLPGHAKPDKRVTLFWAPEIQTDSLGKATIHFYNNDAITIIKGEIEGLSTKGKPGHSVFEYEIAR